MSEEPKPVTPEIQAQLAAIDLLEVSDSWKQRLRAIAIAGGPKLPRWKEMQQAERRAAMRFNLLAFLFSPFYYLAKGMWRRALTLSGLCILVIMLVDFGLMMAGVKDGGRPYGIAVGVFYSLRANLDYYKKVVLKDNGWW